MAGELAGELGSMTAEWLVAEKAEWLVVMLVAEMVLTSDNR